MTMPTELTIKDVLRGTTTLFRRSAEHGSSPEVLKVRGEVHRKLVLDSINYFLSKIIPGLMGFLFVLVFVRLLGYEEYGHYAVVFAIVMASASGMAGWLSQGILRFQSQNTGAHANGLFSTAANLGTTLSLALGAAGVGIGLILSGAQRYVSASLSTALFAALLVYTLSLARFQAELESKKVLQFEVLRSITGFVVPVLILVFTRFRTYRTLLVGVAIGYIVPHLARRIFAHQGSRQHWIPRITGTPEHWRLLTKLWHFGWPVGIWMLCQQALLVSDRLFIQRYSGYSAAGIYSSMYDVVVRSFSLLFMPVTLAVHPLVMDRWNAGKPQHALHAIRSGVKYQLLMFIPIGAVLVGIAPRVSRMVLGRPIPQAAEIVFPLAVSGFLWQMSLLAHKPLEILCETKRMLAGMAVALAVNLIGNRLLIPMYGYKAAAYLAVASSLTYLLSIFVLTPKARFVEALRVGGRGDMDTRSSTCDECVVGVI
jgi:O-antigen/teichoic acid export membrane protein